VPHRFRHHYPPGTRRGTQGVAAVALLCCPQCCLDHRTHTLLVDGFIMGARTIWTGPGPATNSLTAGRVICGSGDKLAGTLRNSPDQNRKPTRLRTAQGARRLNRVWRSLRAAVSVRNVH
jgi:hypothetical protein